MCRALIEVAFLPFDPPQTERVMVGAPVIAWCKVSCTGEKPWNLVIVLFLASLFVCSKSVDMICIVNKACAFFILFQFCNLAC